MEIKISEKKEQPLLSRTKIRGIVGFDSVTPSRAELRQKLSSSLKVDEGGVAVTSIRTGFGERKAVFEAHVYSSPEELMRTESIVVLRRLGLKPKKAKAAKEAKPAKK